MKNAKKLLLALLFAPLAASASGPELKLDRAPDKTRDTAALQRGAQVFVNYCLN
jgi:ubiquinol-cytochrome c reductase cytochrome c1 subunit